ncbi:unnamed protein product, partial [Brenthis ino]
MGLLHSQLCYAREVPGAAPLNLTTAHRSGPPPIGCRGQGERQRNTDTPLPLQPHRVRHQTVAAPSRPRKVGRTAHRNTGNPLPPRPTPPPDAGLRPQSRNRHPSSCCGTKRSHHRWPQRLRLES